MWDAIVIESDERVVGCPIPSAGHEQRMEEGHECKHAEEAKPEPAKWMLKEELPALAPMSEVFFPTR